MKASELQIGDWVRIHYKGESTIAKVAEIYKNSIFTEDGEWEGMEVEENDIVPIPLTPEILEKNGFENVGQDVYQIEERPFWVWWESDRRRLGVDVDESSQIEENFGEVLRLPVVYVHELQHAIRLCQIEKEIEL